MSLDWLRGYWEQSYPASVLEVTPHTASVDQTVDDVKADVEAGEVSAADALAAELAGKNRVTLVAWLEAQTAQPVEEEEPE